MHRLGVRNVNTRGRGLRLLTFGTYAVRNVNTRGPGRRLLTKRTPADPAPSMPKFGPTHG
jgi:hypothetical protein